MTLSLQAPQGMVTRYSAVQNKPIDGFTPRGSSLTGFSVPEDSKISSCMSFGDVAYMFATLPRAYAMY